MIGADVGEGRIWSIRKAGAKLVFIDIVQDGYLVQCVVNRSMIEDRAVKQTMFAAIVHDFHRGDSMSMHLLLLHIETSIDTLRL